MAQVTGLNIKFVASHNNSKGYINSPNGSYNRATNTITIDINSMKKIENASYINGAMLYTASHELTHVAELNTDTYEALHSAVVSAIGNDNWERLIAKHTKDISKSRNINLVTQVTEYFDEVGGYVNTDYGKIEFTKKVSNPQSGTESEEIKLLRLKPFLMF